MIGAPVISASGREAGLWSRWVCVHMIAADGPAADRAFERFEMLRQVGAGIDHRDLALADQIGLRAVISEGGGVVREDPRDARLELLQLRVRRVHGVSRQAASAAAAGASTLRPARRAKAAG